MAVIFNLLFALTVAATPDEGWMLRQYVAGDLDTLETLLPLLPESSATGMFLKSIFESNPDTARLGYERILMDHPGSAIEPFVLNRLVDYYHVEGDSASESRYARLLRERHPDQSPQLSVNPPPDVGTPPSESRGWSVQVGAFRTRKSAEATGQRVGRFGRISYVEKKNEGGKFVAVQVGLLQSKSEAQSLADQISTATGLTAVVVAIGR